MSSPLQNIYLLRLQKLAGVFTTSMKVDYTKQIIRQAINCLNNIPPKKIQKAIILVCKDDDEHTNLKSLIADKFPELKLAPFGISLSDGSTLIDPNQYIAYPEKDLNFIDRCYLAKYIKEAKFIFPITLSQISQISLMNIQSLLINFFYLFKDLDDQELLSLAKSCAIMALDINSQEQQQLYKQRLLRPNGLLEQGFMKNYRRNTQVLLNTIAGKNKIFWGNYKENIMDQFQFFLQKIDFFRYKDKIKPTLAKTYFRYCQERLQISSIWHSLISFFYESIPLIIENHQKVNNNLKQLDLCIYEENNKQSNHQPINLSYKLNAKQLLLLVPKKRNQQQSYTFLGSYQPKTIIEPIPVLAIIYSKLIIIRLQIQINESQANDKVPGQSKLMEYFSFLYNIGCISTDIYVFLASYYHIYHYLSTKTNDHKKDLIQKVTLLQIKKEKDFSIIRSCINLLLHQLQHNQLGLQNSEQITVYLKKIIEGCSQFKEKLAITSKTLSNLQNHLANIYYKILKSQKNKKQYSIKSIHFLSFLINCKDHHEAYKIDILKDVVKTLLPHQHSYKLGHKLACLLPQYEVQQILINFYESKIGLCPQRFRFLEQTQKQGILRLYFSDYANYLLKIGYNHKLRQLCISGLQATINILEQQYFRTFLIKTQNQAKYQQFINNSILQQKQIVVTNDLIDQIKKEMIYLYII